MAEKHPIAPAPPAKPPLGFLGWIAAYKLLKSAATLALGIASLRYSYAELHALMQRWVIWLDLNPHGKLIESIGNHLLHLSAARFQWVRGALFFYFVLFAVEGIGLLMEERWAEWLTVFATVLLLIPAVYEMMHVPTLNRWTFVQVNFGVMAYLLWRIGWETRRRARIVVD